MEPVLSVSEGKQSQNSNNFLIPPLVKGGEGGFDEDKESFRPDFPGWGEMIKLKLWIDDYVVYHSKIGQKATLSSMNELYASGHTLD